MQRIVMGGVSHIVGNKTDYQLGRFKKWYEKESQRAVDEILGDRSLKSFRTRRDLIEHLIKSFKLGMTCVQFLGFLHEKIAQLWINIVDDSSAEFTEIEDTHPPNYSVSMARIKNLRFAGWDHTTIQGFCPFEPIPRLTQLLRFPIEKFGTAVHLDNVTFDAPPTFPGGILKITTPALLKKEILACEPELRKWEQYYDSLCKNLMAVCDGLD